MAYSLEENIDLIIEQIKQCHINGAVKVSLRASELLVMMRN